MEPAVSPWAYKVCNAPRTRAGIEMVLNPFTVQVDTREQRPYVFSNCRTNQKEGDKLISVPLEFAALRDGDYSIVGMTDRVAVERKSKEDLYGSIGQRRQNFKDRLEQLSAITLGGGYAAVMVECEQSDLLMPPKGSKMNGRALGRTILAWRQRYRVDWWFVAGRENGEQYTFRILERFYLDSLKDQS